MKGLTLVLIGNRFDRGVFLKAGQHPDFHFEQASQLSELSKHYPDAQALIVRSGTTIDSDLLDKLPKLKLVVTATAGFDHIDLIN